MKITVKAHSFGPDLLLTVVDLLANPPATVLRKFPMHEGDLQPFPVEADPNTSQCHVHWRAELPQDPTAFREGDERLKDDEDFFPSATKGVADR